MEVVLKNIQSIVDGRLDFGETGVVQISGGNSNGKSIFMNALLAIAKNDVKNNIKRSSYINDNSDWGSVSIINNGNILHVTLHRDREKCTYILQRANGERIVRTFREGVEPLIEEFGFALYANKSICLQFHETFGAIPFINTSDAINYEVVESITTDNNAQTFVDNYKDVTYKKLKEQAKYWDDTYNSLKKNLEIIKVYDYTAYEEYFNRTKRIYDIVKYLTPIKLERLKIPRNVNIIDISAPDIKRIPIIDVMPIIKIDSLAELLGNLSTLKEGKCPVCLRKWDSNI